MDGSSCLFAEWRTYELIHYGMIRKETKCANLGHEPRHPPDRATRTGRKFNYENKMAVPVSLQIRALGSERTPFCAMPT